MVIGSTWMAVMEELDAKKVVELAADEVKLEEAAMMKFELEAVLLVEVEGRQVLCDGTELGLPTCSKNRLNIRNLMCLNIKMRERSDHSNSCEDCEKPSTGAEEDNTPPG